MANLKVSVDIDVNNENQMQALTVFLSALKTEGSQTVTETKKSDKKTNSSKTVANQEPKVETEEKVVEPIETDPAQEEKTEDSKNSPSVKIEDIRAIVSQKVGNYRTEIKNKLTEYGANNVTALDESKYEEFATFLNSLK